MDLLNKEVRHKVFGKGIVVEQSDSSVTVNFEIGEKKFVFPDAFDKFLELVEKETRELVDEKLQKIKDERQAKRAERLKVEAMLREQRRSAAKGNKDNSSLQVVFWCDADEIDEVFTDWTIFTGEIKSGEKKGQPNKLARLNQNSVCLLTKRDDDEEEENRRILGYFMVNEGFSGRLCEDGIIPAHGEFRIRFSEEESKEMLFWKYYTNTSYPDRITWKTGRSRYFENMTMAQILKDTISMKTDPDEKELVERFLTRFCQLNLIDENSIPDNDGVLSRM